MRTSPPKTETDNSSSPRRLDKIHARYPGTGLGNKSSSPRPRTDWSSDPRAAFANAGRDAEYASPRFLDPKASPLQAAHDPAHNITRAASRMLNETLYLSRTCGPPGHRDFAIGRRESLFASRTSPKPGLPKQPYRGPAVSLRCGRFVDHFDSMLLQLRPHWAQNAPCKPDTMRITLPSAKGRVGTKPNRGQVKSYSYPPHLVSRRSTPGVRWALDPVGSQGVRIQPLTENARRRAGRKQRAWMVLGVPVTSLSSIRWQLERSDARNQ
ncbi:hypothetical protein DFP72DRAFT_160816 [Ephemerocybe angulata]|uniref:Uncharacterized protein n=1 Tax=Ephemerocybe angulata TaxID=980116 RepID=A0A8H6I6J9_9AGAR|nr:hypothetical protein DFP72DRAFT_160816 [Tulosesus angulatus]